MPHIQLDFRDRAGRHAGIIVGHTSRIGALRPLLLQRRTREERGRSRTRRWLEKHRRQRAAELRRAVAQPARRAASYRGADIIETETEAPSSLLLSLPQAARVVPHGGSRACQEV